MVFASLTFIFYFLPACVVCYFAIPNLAYRNALLTFFSLLFYAWGEPIWVGLLIFSAGVDYFNALWIEKYRDTKLEILGVYSSLIVNLGVLVAFKYNVFLYENINYLFNTDWNVPKYVLPVGISFYTFQTISYTIDVYKREVPAQRSFMDMLLFVSLFHQLVAGPIVRYAHIAKEIESRPHPSGEIFDGILRFCAGLFKKVFIADVAGELSRAYLDTNLNNLHTGEAWFGIIMFSIQIYFDFSGYSDMAIGLGKMFGFHYLENFNYPYIARSASDFWRRWHISLGSFFRDYVYIPLGGNKKNLYFNLFVVWFLTGLWHGASWNYVLWGLYFGVLIALERLFLQKILDKISFFAHFYLIFIAVLGWALFYFESLPRLGLFFQILFAQAGQGLWSLELSLKLQENAYWLAFSLICCLPLWGWFSSLYQRFTANMNATLVENLTTGAKFGLTLSLLLLSVAMLAGSTYKAFLYYRF